MNGKHITAPSLNVAFGSAAPAPLQMLASISIAIVAALHVYFLALEMFLWDTPYGRRVFRLSPEFSKASKALAANQGLYNGFLAAGLVWGLFLGGAGGPVKVFFLVCVVVAGVYGGMTVSRRIVLVQSAPAAIALLLHFTSR